MASTSRTAWTDERLDDKMDAIDSRLDRIEAEMRGMRSDFAAFQDRMIQIGFGIAAALFLQLITAIIAITVALAR